MGRFTTIIFIICLCAMFFTNCSREDGQTAHEPSTPTPNLDWVDLTKVIHLKFDAPPQGDVIVDDSPAKNEFRIHGEPLQYDVEDQAIVFDGQTNYLELPAEQVPEISGQPFVVVCEFEYAGKDGVILSHRNKQNGYCFELLQDSYKAHTWFFLSLRKTEIKSPTTIGLGGAYALHKGWHRVAFALKTDGRKVCFHHGKPTTSGGRISDGEGPLYPKDFYAMPENQPLLIGKDFDGNYFKGKLKELILIPESLDEPTLRVLSQT